ncbi:MAG: hypothetical protein J1F60_02215 [Oscillospiraceae bacterium]|nr:hypothetical protein [Oscillospiraceae bacterium]
MNTFTPEIQEAIVVCILFGAVGIMAAYYFINDFLTYRNSDKAVSDMIKDNEMPLTDKETNLWWILGNVSRFRGNSMIFRWGYDRVINKIFGFLCSQKEE